MGEGNELGDFLRARRALVAPESVDLPADPQRRVTGLRREEVALLASVSTDYYSRLEQGRERHPSDQVVGALARVLQLGPDAEAHLSALAQGSAGVKGASPFEVDADLMAMLEGTVAAPGLIVGPAMDVLAANSQAHALYRGFDRLDNLAHNLFLDPFAVRFYAEWEVAAADVVANLRAMTASFTDDPRVTRVLGALTLRSPAFTTLWARHDVKARVREVKTFHHPDIGDITVNFRAFSVSGSPGQHLFLYVPEPHSAGAEGLRRLTGRGDQETTHRVRDPAATHS
ncbi:helix-turn-helix transcriptional regulator [Allobranchiibius huperziae]|uniref:Transcriptional regulator with XRE-family HTH domain n=1 Tax=Allobranchiibius huperziae TaxID=1874116 RepID=A0A853DMC0_9MICO|nr:helix-turn-helix transcriptional regulator [Allobranchiibius huperziae]NYJ75275.1 transcriptional regulator with XRE-family HTH domain [Allobranchiibius huperziae]